MSERNSSAQQRKAFGNALAVAIADAHVEIDVLFALTGADKPESARRTVNRWINGVREPSRPQVREIEKRLGVAPGALSAYLGYVPVNTSGSASIEMAITTDPDLTVEQRHALLNVFRTFKGAKGIAKRPRGNR